jgi:uncharacterized membrane protein
MAQSDLIIMIFEHRLEAYLARLALEMMREQHLFGLEHAAEITRDTSGRTVLHQRMELPANAYPHRHQLSSLLCAVIFGSATERRSQTLAAAGLDEFFVSSVTQALVPDSSALMIYVPHDNTGIDKHALLDAVALLRGALHRTSVPPEIESSLLNHFQVP